ncbi:hypothetical protein FPOAC1_000735 [Fusarium poae]|uniref:hypothetical protein n=1 Tax=Fusarium poae TaxID=36050 RepID=UPI001CE9C345|nr:hypothetical protein FPOAC1_000735 [Fusarium poae]KAG8674763.1 hypothetical protein FPOAC1_000735 [Fusarium poae]
MTHPSFHDQLGSYWFFAPLNCLFLQNHLHRQRIGTATVAESTLIKLASSRALTKSDLGSQRLARALQHGGYQPAPVGPKADSSFNAAQRSSTFSATVIVLQTTAEHRPLLSWLARVGLIFDLAISQRVTISNMSTVTLDTASRHDCTQSAAIYRTVLLLVS